MVKANIKGQGGQGINQGRGEQGQDQWLGWSRKKSREG